MDNEFFNKVASLIEQSRAHIGRTADLTMCVTYYEIGHLIVEQEQGGKARAEYGRGLLKELSEYLQERFGKGFSLTALKNARKFYQVYTPSIQQQSRAELADGQKGHAMPDQFKAVRTWQKGHAMLDEFNPFQLSWSHYLILMRIKNDDERRFHEIEATNQNWSEP